MSISHKKKMTHFQQPSKLTNHTLLVTGKYRHKAKACEIVVSGKWMQITTVMCVSPLKRTGYRLELTKYTHILY
jgi:hypothetical protein